MELLRALRRTSGLKDGLDAIRFFNNADSNAHSNLRALQALTHRPESNAITKPLWILSRHGWYAVHVAALNMANCHTESFHVTMLRKKKMFRKSGRAILYEHGVLCLWTGINRQQECDLIPIKDVGMSEAPQK